MLKETLKRLSYSMVLLVALVFALSGTANAVLFTFDDLSAGQGAGAIETYMKGLYGSDITVTGAEVDVSGPLGTDPYITDLGNYLEISFNDSPITSMSFDWGIEGGPLHIYADGSEILGIGFYGVSIYGTLWSIGSFPSPVTTLRFVTSGAGRISVDNLSVDGDVTHAPEPATMLLFGSGLIGLAGLGRKRFKK